MRIYFCEWNKTNPMHAHWILMRPMPEAHRAKCIRQASNSGNYEYNGFKMPLNMKNINNFTKWKKWISWCDVHARSRTNSTSRSLGAVHRVHWTFSIHSAYLLKSQSENKKSSWNVWNMFMHWFLCMCEGVPECLFVNPDV